MTETLKKTLLTLPPEVRAAFDAITDMEIRDAYIRALRRKRWTLVSIAEATGLTRERVRQIASTTGSTVEVDAPIPTPPRAREKAKPVYIEPTPDTLARLLELQPLAQKVRSNSPKYREEAEEYTKLLNYAHQVEKVTLYRLGKRLGITHGAIRFRLVRYGYMKGPEANTSRVYKPIKEINRVD